MPILTPFLPTPLPNPRLPQDLPRSSLEGKANHCGTVAHFGPASLPPRPEQRLLPSFLLPPVYTLHATRFVWPAESLRPAAKTVVGLRHFYHCSFSSEEESSQITRV